MKKGFEVVNYHFQVTDGSSPLIPFLTGKLVALKLLDCTCTAWYHGIVAVSSYFG